MEHLVDTGLLGAVIDVTTTEIADEVVGGVFSAGPAAWTPSSAGASRTSDPAGRWTW